ncbi:MAG: hypothetical protein ACI90M_003855 [Candidatus Azotimanducaceae bacterium]|jgi:hypothetical protein
MPTHDGVGGARRLRSEPKRSKCPIDPKRYFKLFGGFLVVFLNHRRHGDVTNGLLAIDSQLNTFG